MFPVKKIFWISAVDIQGFMQYKTIISFK
jgi:hypothetical protein